MKRVPPSFVFVHAPHRACSRCAARAFTLIELLVVILLVAVMAGLVAPRVFNSGRRQAEFESSQITQLLSIAARRAALSSEVVAVEYDGSVPQLTLVSLREEQSGRTRRRNWTQDPLVPPVVLSAVDILSAAADGQALGSAGGKWWIDFNPTEPRPAIWLLVGARGSDSGSQWQVELLPEDTDASRRTMSQPSRASTSGAMRIDLDANNQGNTIW